MLPGALDGCWREGRVLLKCRGRVGEGKTCREQGNQSSLGERKRRRVSRDEERRVMDGEGSVRLRKADGEAGETCSALKWAALHSGGIKGLWRSPFVPQPDIGFA